MSSNAVFSSGSMTPMYTPIVLCSNQSCLVLRCHGSTSGVNVRKKTRTVVDTTNNCLLCCCCCHHDNNAQSSSLIGRLYWVAITVIIRTRDTCPFPAVHFMLLYHTYQVRRNCTSVPGYSNLHVKTEPKTHSFFLRWKAQVFQTAAHSKHSTQRSTYQVERRHEACRHRDL